jgi:hypothetical protein
VAEPPWNAAAGASISVKHDRLAAGERNAIVLPAGSPNGATPAQADTPGLDPKILDD